MIDAISSYIDYIWIIIFLNLFATIGPVLGL